MSDDLKERLDRMFGTSELSTVLMDLLNRIGTLEQRIEVLEMKDKERPQTMVYPKDGSPLRPATPEDYAEYWGREGHRWSEEDFRGKA